jgi:hypothetical protein
MIPQATYNASHWRLARKQPMFAYTALVALVFALALLGDLERLRQEGFWNVELNQRLSRRRQSLALR